MPKRKTTRVDITVGSRTFERDEETLTEFAVVMQANVGENHLGQHLLLDRDLSRAINSYVLSANVDRGDYLTTLGPYMHPGAKELFCMVTFLRPQRNGDEQVLLDVKAGVNSAAILLKANGYRVRKHINPVEQLAMPWDDMVAIPEPKSEESPDEQPVETES